MVSRKTFGESPFRNEWFVVEVLDYGIRAVGNAASRSLMISNPKVPELEALAPAFDCFNTDSFVGEYSSKFSIYSLSLHEQELDYASLLVSIH
jgi:hypothetical protein